MPNLGEAKARNNWIPQLNVTWPKEGVARKWLCLCSLHLLLPISVSSRAEQS